LLLQPAGRDPAELLVVTEAADGKGPPELLLQGRGPANHPPDDRRLQVRAVRLGRQLRGGALLEAGDEADGRLLVLEGRLGPEDPVGEGGIRPPQRELPWEQVL